MDAQAAQGAVFVILDAEEDAVDDIHEFFTGPDHGSGSGKRDEGLEPFPVACGQFVEPASLADDQVAAAPVRKHVHAAFRQGAEQICDSFSVYAHEPVLLHFGRMPRYSVYPFEAMSEMLFSALSVLIHVVFSMTVAALAGVTLPAFWSPSTQCSLLIVIFIFLSKKEESLSKCA